MSYGRSFAGAALLALISILPASAKPTVRAVTNLSGGPGSVIWQERQVLTTQHTLDQIIVWNNRQSQVLANLSECGPSAMLKLNNGGYLVSCLQNPRLLVLNSFGQVTETYPRPTEESGLVRVQDRSIRPVKYDLSGISAMVQDSKGGVYIATTGAAQANVNALGKGRIYYLNANRNTLIPVQSNLDYPQGLAVSRNGQQLFVSEAASRQVRRFDIKPNQLVNPQVFACINEIHTPSASAVEDPRPAALAFNNQGQLFIALSGEGRILVTSAQGKTIGSVEVPAPYVTGFSFSRTDRQLYVTGANSLAEGAAGTLYEVQL